MPRLIVIDTNVVCAAVRGDWPHSAQTWFLTTRSRHVITVVTAMELVYGIQRMPLGKRRDKVLAATEELTARDESRVLPLTAAAATLAGALRAAREASGRPLALADAQIAGICLTHDALLATRNVRDFEGLDLDVIDPWTEGL